MCLQKNNCYLSTYVISLDQKNINLGTIIAKGDSAASHHYWRQQDKEVLSNLKNISGPSVLLPNGDKISSTEEGLIPLSPKLSTIASTDMVLPGLQSASLISIGQLCDDNCDVFLNNHTLLAVKEKEVILEGTRNQNDVVGHPTPKDFNIKEL